MKNRYVYIQMQIKPCKPDPWGMSTVELNQHENVVNFYFVTETFKNEKRFFKVRFVCFVSSSGKRFRERAMKLPTKGEAIRDHSHNYDNTCEFSFHLLFNPSLKIASIPSHSGANRALSSRTGFFKQLSNLRTTAVREKKIKFFSMENFGREIFSEATRSYFWDCWVESQLEKSSSVGHNAGNWMLFVFGTQRSPVYILRASSFHICPAQFSVLTPQSTNSLFWL